ncbi:hypothetical protein ACWKSP_40800 [Micromonosporaceae bacterium Da 78-11]
MGSTSDRLRRVTATLAVAGLLGLPAACGAADDDTGTGGTSTAARTKAPAAPQVQGAGSRQAMEDGCEVVRQLLAAIDAGDTATGESLRDQGKAKFHEVATKEETKDKQLASNASAMEQMLEFPLPEKPVYQSELAEVYAVDCVAQYGAPALPG